MARWAVFDVDGTLLPPSSMEKLFILYMLKNGILSLRNIFYYFLTGFLHLFHNSFNIAFKSNKFYLKDMPVQPVRTAGAGFVQQCILPQLSATGLKRLRDYRKQGYRILLMSGSPDFLTLPLAGYLRPDAVITTHPEVKKGRFTGHLRNLHPYGDRKTRLLLRYREARKIDFQRSIVFANHHSDAHHLRLFGEAVAVNPTPKLKRLAENHNWKIEIWK